MHAPAFACELLYRKRPDLRLAWEGQPGAPDELNAGHFCIVRLVPTRKAGTPEQPKIVEDFWDTRLAYDEKMFVFSNIRAERGPVFSRSGGLARDWDALSLVPVIIQRCTKERGMSTEDIFSGRFVKMFEIMDHEEARQAAVDSTVEEGRELNRKVNDGIDAATDRVWSAASKTDQTRHIIARKHLAKSDLELNDEVKCEDWLLRKKGLL